ncbi:MAG: hypothetical protein ABEJ99_00335 [Candidatus Nanohaloarchaea archaeon]
MDKTIEIIIAVMVLLFTAIVAISIFTGQMTWGQNTANQQEQIGCNFQQEHATGADQYSDKCIGKLGPGERNAQIYDRAGVPTV